MPVSWESRSLLRRTILFGHKVHFVQKLKMGLKELKVLVVQSCPTFCDSMGCSPPGSSIRGDSPGKDTGVGCHALLQGIFPAQGSHPGLLHRQADSLPSEPPRKPEICLASHFGFRALNEGGVLWPA